MSFPIGDWQFWAVTVIALGALVWFLRGLLGAVMPGRRAKRRRSKRATLTIEGRPAGERRPDDS